MNTTKPTSNASSDYNLAKIRALNALKAMTQAMKEMGAEHNNFHQPFTDVQKGLEDLKKAYGVKELDVEVIRSTALDSYLSEGNLLKVTAFGHLQMEKVLKEFEEEEKVLGNLQKETVKRVEALLGDRR